MATVGDMTKNFHLTTRETPHPWDVCIDRAVRAVSYDSGRRPDETAAGIVNTSRKRCVLVTFGEILVRMGAVGNGRPSDVAEKVSVISADIPVDDVEAVELVDMEV